jgi:hypothetical protein
MRADKRKFHYIYKITRDDGRYYIGMHSTDDLDDGYFGSGKRITRSIKKHGLDRHKKEILEFLASREELKKRERQLVNEEKLSDALCMNIALGGSGGFISPEYQFKRASAGGKISGPKTIKLLLTPERKAKSLETRRRLNLFNTSIALEYANAPASIAKRKQTFAERKHMQGEKNSQFGTCWVTKDSKPIKIKKEQLDEYLANGYSRGRKN